MTAGAPAVHLPTAHFVNALSPRFARLFIGVAQGEQEGDPPAPGRSAVARSGEACGRREVCYTQAMGIFRPAPLAEAEASRIIETKLRWILQNCEPEEVWIFGSAATKKMTVSSDVDLALLFDDERSLRGCRDRLYTQPRPDAWPQDLAFFIAADFYQRSSLGGLPMLIVQDGKKVFSRRQE